MHKFINYKFDAFAMISERRANDDDNIICLPFNLYVLKNKKKVIGTFLITPFRYALIQHAAETNELSIRKKLRKIV